MPEQVGTWGWYPAGNIWVKIQVDVNGRLVVDPTDLFEEPPVNGEMAKAATANWSFDHNADVNAHHAQAHTLASHTTKAHAELTGVGADDHHTSFTPADHTAIGDAAPHHARSHDHSNALDGSPISPVAIPDIGARVYHNADQSIPDTAWTALAFNSERYDTDSIHDTVMNNSRLTAKTAGKYLINVQVTFAANIAGVRELLLNHSSGATIGFVFFAAASVGNTPVNMTTVWPMAINEYVEVLVLQTSGGALNILSIPSYSPEFMMQRIG